MYFIDSKKLIQRSVDIAKLAAENNEVPIGAIIVDQYGNIISEKYNQMISKNDPTAHAEILAIQEACNKLNTRYLNDYTMYVSLQPCLMCTGAIREANLKMVYYATFNKNNIDTFDDNIHYYESSASIESSNILKKFFSNLR